MHVLAQLKSQALPVPRLLSLHLPSPHRSTAHNFLTPLLTLLLRVLIQLQPLHFLTTL